jgi:hypothetical protein
MPEGAALDPEVLGGPLFEVFAGAALAHHLVEEVLYDHEQKEDLSLLSARHAAEHLQQFGVDLFRQSEAVVWQICH